MNDTIAGQAYREKRRAYDRLLHQRKLARRRGEEVPVLSHYVGMSTEKRLTLRLDRTGGVDSCWPWVARTNGKGYGEMYVSGQRNRLAHRVAYELWKGPIPAGLIVMHSCDNPPCCNPRHLSLGTRAQNTHDAAAKGAFLRKLSLEDIETIRSRGSRRGTATALAALYGVGAGHIRRIVKGDICARIGAA